MTQAAEQLQTALITTFNANLLFLCKYDNKLYQRIEALTNAIYEGEYKERYFLEFIEDSGDFDIYDEHTDEYLYQKEPKKYNNKAMDSVNFDSKGEIFSLTQNLFLKYDLEDNNYEDIKINNALDSYKYVVNEIDEFNSNLKEDFNTERKYKKIEKFIFIGTLLSRHILSIAKKTKAKHYFVCENNLEIFRLSLFVFDYTLLVENEGTVVFSIMEDDSVFSEKFKIFFKNNYLYNAAIKYYSTHYNTEDYFDKIFGAVMESSPVGFNYIHTLYVQIKLSFERIGNYKTITLGEELPFFFNKKVLFLGAGPSLDEKIDWVKENQDSFIIVAMGASYKKVLDSGIKIDILTTLDSSIEIFERQFNEEKYISLLKNTLIIASTITHDKLIKRFDKENLYLFTLDYPFFENNNSPSGYSIGEVTCQILLSLGIKNLYLLGLDFSLNQKTGATHIKESSSNSKTHNLRISKLHLKKIVLIFKKIL